MEKLCFAIHDSHRVGDHYECKDCSILTFTKEECVDKRIKEREEKAKANDIHNIEVEAELKPTMYNKLISKIFKSKT